MQVAAVYQSMKSHAPSGDASTPDATYLAELYLDLGAHAAHPGGLKYTCIRDALVHIDKILEVSSQINVGQAEALAKLLNIYVVQSIETDFVEFQKSVAISSACGLIYVQRYGAPALIHVPAATETEARTLRTIYDNIVELEKLIGTEALLPTKKRAVTIALKQISQAYINAVNGETIRPIHYLSVCPLIEVIASGRAFRGLNKADDASLRLSYLSQFMRQTIEWQLTL